MSKTHDLRQIIGADMPPRFYVDGKRVSRAAFDDIRDDPRVRLDCFATRGRQLPGGLIRRTNFMVAHYD